MLSATTEPLEPSGGIATAEARAVCAQGHELTLGDAMTTATNDLPDRLREHAAAHEELAAHYEPPAAHQSQWAKDLREAAVLVERMQWRDIATAPRSDCENFNAWVVADDGSEWFEQDCYIDDENTIRARFWGVVNGPSQRATHWMPAISGPKGE